MSSPDLLQLIDIHKHHGGQPALDGVTLRVAKGAFVVLVGPSGSGKTTLLKSINRLVEIDRGQVLLDGADVRAQPRAALRRRFGYVFQGTGLFPHLRVGENIAMVPRLMGVPAAERDARVAELLRLVALPEGFATRFPAQLSGGQAQRVGLARALAARPAIMMMDEPFGALDPIVRDELAQAYRALHDALGLTTIMVTHDMTEALLIADRIVVLVAGRIRADATPAQLIAGHDDGDVAALIDVPRRQAERLLALERAR